MAAVALALLAWLSTPGAAAASPENGLPPGVPTPPWAGAQAHFDPPRPHGPGIPAGGSEQADAKLPSLALPPESLEYFGGPVQAEPRLMLIFWGGSWNVEPGLGLSRQLEAMANGLKGSDYEKILTQYDSVEAPIASGANSEFPTVATYRDEREAAPPADGDPVAEVNEVLGLIGKPGGTPDTTYAVLPAPGSAINSEASFCGGHQPYGIDGSIAIVLYAGEAEGCGFADSGTTWTLSHEYAESVTDPGPSKAWAVTVNGWREELADVCNYLGPAQMSDGAWVAELWDDSKDACEVEDADPGVVEIGPFTKYALEATTSVERNSATLEGALAPCGLEAHYYFEYGTTLSYGTSTAKVAVPAGHWGVIQESAQIAGLNPGTTYSWRLVVETSSGVSMGADHEFTTPPNVIVRSERATDVQMTEAQLNGSIDPEGVATKYYFEYGTTPSYGSRTPEVSAGSGGSKIAVSSVIGGLTTGTLYRFRIVATNIYGTTYGQEEGFWTTAVPWVETRPVVSVSDTTAVVEGGVNAMGAETQYHFEYGATTSYGSSTPEASAGAELGIVWQSQSIAGLTANTTYHFRIAASNDDGTSYGEDQVLRTTAKPSVETGHAVAVDETGATLSGVVNPDGFEARYYFEYGTTSGYASRTAAADAGAGTTGSEERQVITGLAPGTTYHYRLVAVDAFAEADGEDRTFTTIAASPIVAPVGALPILAAPPPGPASIDTGIDAGADAGAGPASAGIGAGPASAAGGGVGPASVGSGAGTPAFGDLLLRPLHRDSLLVALTVEVAGSRVEVDVSAPATRPSGAGGRRRQKPVVLARLIRTGVASGRLRATVPASARGRRALERYGNLPLTAEITVTTPTGRRERATRTVTL
jgi:hypothetical protein